MAHQDLALDVLLERPGVRIGTVRYPPGSSTGAPATHPGTEFIYLLQGQLDVSIEGATRTLQPGEHIAFDAARPHQGSNPYSEPARLLFVVIA